MEQVKEMARIVYRALEDKKGEDICIIDISGISPLADYFIITNGSNDSQVKALVDNVEEKMHEAEKVRTTMRETAFLSDCVILNFSGSSAMSVRLWSRTSDRPKQNLISGLSLK